MNRWFARLLACGQITFVRWLVLFLLLGVSALPAKDASAERRTIGQLTSIFENSSPELQYAYCRNIRDGRGLTFGFAGFTSGTYDGTMFLEEYARLRPGNPLERYLPAFRRIDAGPHDAKGRNPSTAGLAGFRAAFRSCARDPAFRTAQENLADRLYWRPALALARRLGAKLPITRGQMYDTTINLGTDGAEELARRASRRAGGHPQPAGETRWLAAFLALRVADLLEGERGERASADRVRVYQRLLAAGNVRLERPIEVSCYGDKFILH